MSKPKLMKDDIAQAVKMRKAGVLQKDIAAYIGVAEETFSRWVNHPKTDNQRQLSQALKKAEAERKKNLLGIIMNAAIGSPSRWQAAAWLLERQYPAEHGQRQRQQVEAKVEAAPLFTFDPDAADG